ncbi:hypothetical protein IGI04_007306 [Brassica rapa subsp. trilocularis]|uniref:SIS domain-containing protein n=1 Tax=Brassica rapa subsp. trilocularis TaxID=1813537 RepID=A0ABQ7NJC0_BRACM|nr:hypothetical protein IGI04_007306 [Brassica rapa subsp. trilocularis]
MNRLSRFRKPNEDGMFREPSRDRRITKLESSHRSIPTTVGSPLDGAHRSLPPQRSRLLPWRRARSLRDASLHLGLSSHLVSDVTTPPISSPDLLIASASPGGFSTVDVICSIAKSCGAKVVLITAQLERGSCVKHTTDVCYVPAQTMASDGGGAAEKG